MAWAFTRLGLLGVWRYLEERRRSKESTFSFSVCFSRVFHPLITNDKTIGYEF